MQCYLSVLAGSRGMSPGKACVLDVGGAMCRNLLKSSSYLQGCETMRPSVTFLVILMIGSVLLLSGCTQQTSVDKRFVGVWKGRFSWAGTINNSVPANITFYSNGKYADFNSVRRIGHGNWTVNGSTLIFSGSYPPFNYTYTFSNGNKQLWLSSTDKEFTPVYLWNLTKS